MLSTYVNSLNIILAKDMVAIDKKWVYILIYILDILLSTVHDGGVAMAPDVNKLK